MPYINLLQLMDCCVLLPVIMNHCLQAKKLKNFIYKNGIKHITTAPYHPSSNGAAKRVVQTFKSAMHKIVTENSNVPIKRLISRFLFSYRNTSHIQTGKAPSELLSNQNVNTRLSF